MKHRIPLLLTAICSFGFLLRFFAISHGIGYHPDERGIVMMTESLTWANPFPRSFAYGSLPFYLLKGLSETASFLWPEAATYDGLFYTGRFINALISVWLINATFRLGVNLFNRLSVGYWAAFLIATNTFVLQNSHFFTVDILLTTLSLEALIAMAAIAERGKWRHYLIAAITIGLALATKIGALTLLAPASFAFLMHRFQFRENPLPILLILGGIGVSMAGGSHLLGGMIIGVGAISAIILHFFGRSVTSSWRGWRYPIVCAPLIAIIFFLGEPYAFDWKGTTNFWDCLRSDGRCSLLSILFSDRFLADVGGEIAMVRGVVDPRPYTVQYTGTAPFLYPLQEAFWTTLGPLTALLVIAGILLELVSPPTRARAVPLFWALIFTGSVAGSFVKFPRYLLPLYPLLFCYAGQAIVYGSKRLSSSFQKLEKAGPSTILNSFLSFVKPALLPLLTILLAVPLIIRVLAFSSIYSVPHPYQIASRWVFDNVPRGSRILGVHWDDKLPIDLPGFSTRNFLMWSPEDEIGIYEPDSQAKIATMAEQLTSADYLIFPSAKIPASVPRWPERYPFSARFIQELFNGNLGFKLEKTVKNYPALAPFFSINDDISDESLTLYDHPKVYIFRRTDAIPVSDFISRVNNAPFHPINDTIHKVQTASAESSSSHPPFTPYTLGSLIAWACVIELLSWIVRLPLIRGIGLSEVSAGFASRPAGIFLFFGFFWWLNAVDIAHATSGSIWIVAVASVMLRLMVKGTGMRQYLSESSLLFWFSFLSILIFRSFQGEIFWGEKPMDFSFLNYFLRETNLPPTDPWASGNPMRYYYLGTYLFGQMAKMSAVGPGVAYNLAIATVAACFVSALAALISNITSSSPRLASLLACGIFFISNPEAVLSCLAGKKVTFDTFWASTRLFKSPAFAEYPLWATFHADLHAHYIASPLGVLVALGVSLLTIKRSTGMTYMVSRVFLGTMVGLLVATNSWDAILLAIIGSAVGLLLLIYRIVTDDTSSIIAILGNSILDLLVVGLSATVVALPFLVNNILGSTPLGFGYVYEEEFNNLSHLARHFGIWLVIIAVTGFGHAIIYRRERLVFQFVSLIFFVAPVIALYADTILVRNIPGVRYSLFFVATAIGIIAHHLWCEAIAHQQGDERQVVTAGLLWSSAFVLVFAELRYVSDRMNTIFKFYTPLWWVLGVVSAALSVRWFQNRSNRIESSVSSLISVALAALSCPMIIILYPETTHHGAILLVGAFFLIVVCFTLIVLFRQGLCVRIGDRFPNIWDAPTAIILTASVAFGLLGSVLNGYSLTKIHRAPQPSPSLDGTAYLSASFNTDWDICRWLNQNVRGTEIILEATGAPYQDYTRISMNTGLSSVLGWEHHTNQRGTAREEILRRRQSVKLIYSTQSAEEALTLLKRYRVRYVIVGSLETQLYATGFFNSLGEKKFQERGDLFIPMLRSGTSVLYRVVD
jgi:uncharacterized membrane protein